MLLVSCLTQQSQCFTSPVKKSLQISKPLRHFPMFYSRSFVILSFTFKSMLHFELIFIYVMKWIFFIWIANWFRFTEIIPSPLDYSGTSLVNQANMYVYASLQALYSDSINLSILVLPWLLLSYISIPESVNLLLFQVLQDCLECFRTFPFPQTLECLSISTHAYK